MSDIYAGESKIQGTGCFAARRFKKGEIIGEYTGERISGEEADRRHEDEEHFYIFALDDGTCIDPHDDPSPMKYINHSCEGNCESEEIDGHIFIRALCTIEPDEELTYDYCVQAEDDEDLECFCGADTCRGTMRDSDQ